MVMISLSAIYLECRSEDIVSFKVIGTWATPTGKKWKGDVVVTVKGNKYINLGPEWVTIA